jgi:hypothetical protein
MLLMSHNSHEQPSGAEYKIQTLLIYNFTKYVKWSTSNGSDFTIAVYGNSQITNYLNQLKASKQVNGKAIVVKTMNPGDKLPSCDLLYIDDQYIHQAENQFNKGSLFNILVVTNTTPIPMKLSCINLKLVDDNYKFEINNTNTSINNLEVSSALLNLALKVYK